MKIKKMKKRRRQLQCKHTHTHTQHKTDQISKAVSSPLCKSIWHALLCNPDINTLSALVSSFSCAVLFKCTDTEN